MQYTTLGRPALRVSRICMGCMGFGDAQNAQHSWALDEEHSRAVIRRVAERAEKRGVFIAEVAPAWPS